MPPKPRYTPDRILDAALAVTRESGIEAVTARNVAARLGSSTGPVSSSFASMDALHEALMDRVIALFVARAEAAGAGPDHGAPPPRDPLLVAGEAWLRFAAEEPRLYAAVFLRHHPWHAKWGPVRRAMARRMADHPRYVGLDDRERFGLVGRASIVLHGLGLEIWAGRLPATDLSTLLDQLVLPVVDAALAHAWTADLHTLGPAPEPQQRLP